MEILALLQPIESITKTNLTSHAWAHVLPFIGDLALSAQQMITFFSLRLQLEFNFKDAKQFWGLEVFMNIEETAVTNAANLPLFMVNVAQLYCPKFVKPILILVC